MSKVSPNLQRLTDELAANRRAEVEEAIARSPYLRQIMTEAVDAGTLEHIRIGVPGGNEGGHYNYRERAIYLSSDAFTKIFEKEARIDSLASTLGHEAGHGLYAKQSEKTLYFTAAAVTDGLRAAGPGGEFDATALASVYLRNARRDEALAEMHGWNALASRLEYTNGGPVSQREMLERADASTNCVTGPQNNLKLAPGIVLAPDMQLSDTRLPKAGPINLEPVAQCHFDRSRANLGAGGAANYPNYYGAYLIQQLADDTRGWDDPPKVKLDMATLGLDKAQLESTGLRLPAEGFGLVDISHGGYRPMVLRSSGSGVRGTPEPDTEMSQTPRAAEPAAPPAITDPQHIAHGGWRDARHALAGFEGAQWQMRDAAKQDQRAAALFAGAVLQDRTFTGIDKLLASDRLDPQTGRPLGVIALQGPGDVDWHRRALVNENTLDTMTMRDASRDSQTQMQSWQQTQAQDRQRALEESLQQGAMTLSMGGRTLPAAQSADAGGDG
jgi:hypothetical protein